MRSSKRVKEPAVDGRSETLNKDIINWLLDGGDSSVRYFTLLNVLDSAEEDAEVQEAKKNIMLDGPVPEILGMMRADGYSSTLPRFYRDKYKGLCWQLIILAELGADGENEDIKRRCEYIFENSQVKGSGAFSMETSVKNGGGRMSAAIPCLTGNMIFALSRLGFARDARVLKAAEWLAENQRYEDGDGEVSSKLKDCWGAHSCYMGAVKALKGFAELPREARFDKVGKSIEAGVEFLLKHRVYKQSHDLSKPLKPGWTKFSFPLMYQTDALEILLILLKLGVTDERMSDAAELVIMKRDSEGCWTQQSAYQGKFLLDIEENGKSKWITLRALEALKIYYGGKV